MLKQKRLSELHIGDEFIFFLLVNKLELKTAKNGKPYLDLELRDKSSNLSAKIWDNFDKIVNTVKLGDVVKVAGKIEEYMGSPQIKATKIRPAEKKDNVAPEDFLPKSEREFSEMKSEFFDRAERIKNHHLKQLIFEMLDETTFEKYSKVPAGKSWHHAYIHGLLEHTLEIVKICDLMCDIHSELNRDLLITGAMLHDFGKVEELSYDAVFDYTDKGKLLGHIVIAATEIEKGAAKIDGFPEELKNQLIHLVLSHQGKLEFASPVEPKTIEAITLYHADELSAKTNAYKNAIKNEENSGNKWTKFLYLANTSLYIPPKKEDQSKSDDTLFDN